MWKCGGDDLAYSGDDLEYSGNYVAYGDDLR